MKTRYILRYRASGKFWELLHPDGYWIGPGLGQFRSVADAMVWLEGQR